MRLSFFIAPLFMYVVGCLAVAFAAVLALELVIGDMGSLIGPLVFAAILLALVSQARRVFNPLMLRMHAKEHARNVQLIAEARQSAAQLPAWSSRSELEAALRHVGLGEWAPRLAELARHCILLVPGSIDEGAAPIGASRLGGQPDMPPDLNWPLRPPVMAPWEGPQAGPVPGRITLGGRHWLHRLLRTRQWKQAVQRWERSRQIERDVRNREWPLSFVAQIDFAELHAVCALDGFPPTGRLLFFCDPFDWPWGEEADQARVRVIFTEVPSDHLQRKAFPREFDDPRARELMPRGYALKTRVLRPTAWLLPPASSFAGRLHWPGWTDALSDAYEQFWLALYARHPEALGLNGEAGIHQVGGIAWSIQEPVEAACAKFAGDGPEFADNWQLVLQIDSDVEVGIEWGDAGRLYLCARKEELAAGRFDRCWTVMQCY